MKKMNFTSISVIISVLLFASCDFTEKKDLVISDLVESAANNNQGEHEDNGKKSPVAVPSEGVQDIPFKISAIVNSMGSRKSHNLFTIVRSKEELNQAASERFFQIWTDTGGLYNVYYLADLTEKYDDEYFTDNALILYLFEAAYTGGRFEINKIQREGSKLTAITDFHMGMAAAISYWTIVLEAAQSAVYGVTALENVNECICPPPPVRMISVVLTYEATVAAYHADKTYTPADFPEYNFSTVENLFTMKPTGPHFKRILFLYLAEPVDSNDENFLRAVELIRQRNDIEFIE